MDFTKGVLIWLVVFGHAIQYIMYAGRSDFFSDPIFSFIYMFHMPLFMATSGYFLNIQKAAQRPPALFVLDRGKGIMLPMVTWVAIGTVSAMLFGAMTGAIDPWNWVELFVTQFATSYWFLWAVFLSYVTVRVLLLLPWRLKYTAPPVALGFVISPLAEFPLFGFVLMMFSFAFPFFLLGIVASRMSLGHQSENARRIVLVSGLLFCAAYFIWQPAYFSYLNKMDVFLVPVPVLMTFLGGLVGCMFVFEGFKILGARYSKTASFDWFARIGQISLQIYLFQTFIFLFLIRVGVFSMVSLSWVAMMCLCLLFTFIVIELVRWMANLGTRGTRVQTLLWGR